MSMTASDICIEQSWMNQASTFTNCWRGFTVWMPYDVANNIWQGWELSQNPNIATDAVTCNTLRAHWKAKFFAGQYIPNSVANTPASVAYNGIWTDLATTDNGGTVKGWQSAYRNGAGYVELTVPAACTRLYMYADPPSASGAATGTVTVQSGTATLFNGSPTTANLVYTTGNDFGTYDGFYNNNYKLIATNVAINTVLRFTRSTGGTIICGWLLINDATLAQPDTGVFDPTTLVNLEPASSEAEGPIYLRFAAQTPFFWGLGHWRVNPIVAEGVGTITGEAELKVYDTDAADSQAAVLTDNTQVNTKATSFTRILTGVIQTKNGAEVAQSVGTYTGIYNFSAKGLGISLKHVFDADVDAIGSLLYVATTANIYGRGGYLAKWNLPDSFNRFKLAGGSTFAKVEAPWDDSVPAEGYGSQLIGYSPTLNSIIKFYGRGKFYNTTAAISNTWIYVVKASAGSAPKLYATLGDIADINLAAGDTIESEQFRQVYPEEVFMPHSRDRYDYELIVQI